MADPFPFPGRRIGHHVDAAEAVAGGPAGDSPGGEERVPRPSIHAVVTVTTSLSVLLYRPSHCRPTCAVRPVLAVTRIVDHQHPAPYGAVIGSARSSSSRRVFTDFRSHTDSDRKNCSRYTAGSFDPVTDPCQGGQRLVTLPRRQQPRHVLTEPPPLRHVGEKVIETGPSTPPADPEQPGMLSAWSSHITGSQTRQQTYLQTTLTSIDSTDYR